MMEVIISQWVTVICLCLLGLWLAWIDDKYNDGWKEYEEIKREIKEY